MKPIIFVRVAYMMYYQGITDEDTPMNGGSYVQETGKAHECCNFLPIIQEGEDYEKCIGYFQMLGKAEQLHIENIVGCSALKDEESVNGVIVVFVSKAPNSSMRAVGFYKNATVYRRLHGMHFGEDDVQYYLLEAKKEDCVLLPYQERHKGNKWFVPSSTSKHQNFGMGRSNIWYCGNKGASQEEIAFTNRFIDSVESYDGENWIDYRLRR